MKIVFYGNIASAIEGSPLGGGEYQLSLIAKQFALNNNVVVLDTVAPKSYKINNIDIVSLKYKYFNNHLYKIFNLFFLYKELIKSKGDIYYGRIRGYHHILAVIAAYYNSSKVVYHCAHDLDFSDLKSRIKNFYLKKGILYSLKSGLITEILFYSYIKRVDLVVLQHKNQFSNILRNKQTIIIPNIFNPPNISLYKNSINLKFDDYILYVGSIDKRKGFDNMIKTAKLCPNQNFVIIGKVRSKSFEEKVIKFMRLPNVSYLGYLEHDNVINVLSNAQCLISTSLGEGFPNVFIEAWSQGIPTISLNVDPGNSLTENEIGYYAEGDLSKLIGFIKGKDFKKIKKNTILSYFKTTFENVNVPNFVLKKLNLDNE
tara:strand:+ start:1086 stop:2201 length:1116 start_codon:yes stop_codon:yes gene_type:complete